MLAANEGHLDIVEALILNGADVNARNSLGWTALMKAIYNYDLDRGFPGIVSTLIEAGSEIETTIAYGTRPLMLAAGYGQAEVVDVLLEAGADVLARNEGGLTARTMAEYKDYVQVINQLYEAELRTNSHISGACSTKDSGGASVIRFTQNPRS
jgi:ankyrin repeat protein